MSATPHGGSGTTLTVAGSTFTVTSITVNFSELGNNFIDVSHLGQTAGETIKTIPAPLKGSADGETGKEISFDYIGTTQLTGGQTGSYAITGGVSLNGTACTVVSSSLTLAVNDVIRGSATVRIS